MANFYVVATPIGNLEDITLRALRILKEVDFILCEDTRQTKKLLSHYKIETSTLSYHQHSQLKKIDSILDLLKQGRNLALVCNAGTPGISDPGQSLINYILRKLPETKIIPISGPCALITAVSISGFSMDEFLFLGFLPKKKRKKILDKIAQSKETIIFYESPYRIIKTLNDLELIIPDRKIVLCREMTKKFETIYRGNISEVLSQLLKGSTKGEFTIVIEGRGR